MEKYSIISYLADKDALTVQWADGHTSVFYYIYLRDNCPSLQNIHENGQKITETAQLDPDIRPAYTELIKNETIAPYDFLTIVWERDGHESNFSAGWLRDHCLSKQEIEKRKARNELFEPIELWDSTLGIGVPQAEYHQVNEDKTSLTVWLEYVRRYGFAVLNNLASTSLALSPRTDNPYRDPAPTLQLLHCLQNEVQGGDTIVADGFKVATMLRTAHPGLFELLSTIPVNFRFRDKDHWIERKVTIIGLNPQKELHSLRFNNRSIQAFEMDNELIPQFYRAYQTFARMLDDPAYQVRFKMIPGQLFIADNERILHGRTSFDRKEGKRHLQGTYADRDGLLSKLRILKQGLNP
ncbi:gamma-butyrobetaine dioxygenase [Pedobacter cryoconitis]|uniref:TauD/TfdA family dioxygenase n=1 Tax=Pedobacter cryoconitis TaxID=188932 RepID=UPI00160AE9CF|nr:TauD/TfdA family dioxygenase [Pedobacter cryoconitis]MBB6274122.1 gamma-butyrobetaine dioxygenase [Pedobacter cryoconitis]